MKTDNKDNAISYSQFAMWKECPFRWYLAYVKKLKTYTTNINTLFGSAFHETLQSFLTTMYKDGVIAAHGMDLRTMLRDNMANTFTKAIEDEHEMEISQEDMESFFLDGVEILDWFIQHRGDYFQKRGYELVGVEVPIDVPMSNNIRMIGYLDIVIRDTILNKIHIYDIKTSTNGWNKYQKVDKKKLMQLVIYKMFYAQQYGVDPKNIEVEFLVVKRKLYENSTYPQKRVQRIAPASGQFTQNEVMCELMEFVESSFDSNGQHRLDVEYPKYPSPKACKYCDYAKDAELCDRNKKKKGKIGEQK